MKFSQRIGITKLKKEMQIEDMDLELRTGLYNMYYIYIVSQYKSSGFAHRSGYNLFFINIWIDYFKLPLDQMSSDVDVITQHYRKRFFDFKWYEVYDFLEYILDLGHDDIDFNYQYFEQNCNEILERENAAYRFIGKKVAPITNEIEINEIEESIYATENYTAFIGANCHLKNALAKLSSRDNPDYRNSIKESISAVESVVKVISKHDKATLDVALTQLKKIIEIHPAFENGLKKIYGYTSDSDGIRHGLMDAPNLDFEDAKFMLVLCSSFCNYLIAKANKGGLIE